jgi:uncharacterized protein (TIGR02145 family)
MKKIFVALCMVALLAACDDSSSASAENNDPTTLSSAEGQGNSSSSKPTSGVSESSSSSFDESLSSSSEEIESSSSPEQNAESSSSEKLSATSSSSVVKVFSSSSSEMGCKTRSEDNCEYGELIDDRDGQTYKTVKIGSQWWMAENLNYQTGNSWCGGGYSFTEGDCAIYGRLYTWATAIGRTEETCGYEVDCDLGSGNVQGVCPDGWHVPTQDEWNVLIDTVGGKYVAGQNLKAITGWNSYIGMTNKDAYGFSALPAGDSCSIKGVFDGVGSYAYFWSATQGSSQGAYHVQLGYGDYDVSQSNYCKRNGFSVRCVKD